MWWTVIKGGDFAVKGRKEDQDCHYHYRARLSRRVKSAADVGSIGL